MGSPRPVGHIDNGHEETNGPYSLRQSIQKSSQQLLHGFLMPYTSSDTKGGYTFLASHNRWYCLVSQRRGSLQEKLHDGIKPCCLRRFVQSILQQSRNFAVVSLSSKLERGLPVIVSGVQKPLNGCGPFGFRQSIHSFQQQLHCLTMPFVGSQVKRDSPLPRPVGLIDNGRDEINIEPFSLRQSIQVFCQ